MRLKTPFRYLGSSQVSMNTRLGGGARTLKCAIMTPGPARPRIATAKPVRIGHVGTLRSSPANNFLSDSAGSRDPARRPGPSSCRPNGRPGRPFSFGLLGVLAISAVQGCQGPLLLRAHAAGDAAAGGSGGGSCGADGGILKTATSAEASTAGRWRQQLLSLLRHPRCRLRRSCHRHR